MLFKFCLTRLNRTALNCNCRISRIRESNIITRNEQLQLYTTFCELEISFDIHADLVMVWNSGMAVVRHNLTQCF